MKIALASLMQPLKALPLIHVTPDGIVTLVRPMHWENTSEPMPMRLVGSVTLVKEPQY